MNEKPRFGPGAIVRLKLTDFMSHGDIEFFFGPNLNIIVGPNGVGKSAVMNALCLGLGGNMKLLGRSTVLIDYIRWNKDQGCIEIELSRGGPPRRNTIVRYFITRLTATNSRFTIDGKGSTREQVRNLCAELHIQLDNPCTFLPQDKVKEFAEQNPQKLLENTQRAIGDSSLLDQHKALMNLGKEGSAFEEEVNAKEQALKRLQGDIEVLKENVKAYEDRAQAEQRLQRLKLKQLNCAYDRQKAECQLLRDRKAELVEEQNRLQLQLNPADEKIKELEQHIGTLNRSLQDATKKIKDKSPLKDVHVIREKCRKIADQAPKNKGECKECIDKLRRQLNEIDKEQQMPEAELKKTLASLNEQLLVVNRESDPIGERIYKIRDQIIQKRHLHDALVREIRQLKPSSEQKLTLLKTRNRHAHDAWIWYTQNQAEFSAQVFMPFLTLRLEKSESAKLLESLVPQRDLFMFIFGNSYDEDRMAAEAQKHNWRINTTIAKNTSQATPAVTQEMRAMGIECYGSQLYVDAPNAVHNYLCAINNVHRIPIASAAAKSRVGEIFTRFPFIWRFLMPDTSASCKRSKYGQGQPSIREDPLKKAALLLQHTENSTIEPKQKELENVRKAIDQLEKEKSAEEAKKNDVDRNLNSLREQITKLKSKVDYRRQTEVRLQRERTRLAGFSKPKIEMEEAKAAEDRKSLVTGRHNACRQLEQMLLEENATKKLEGQTKRLFIQISVLKGIVEQMKDEQKEWRQQLDEAKRKVAEAAEMVAAGGAKLKQQKDALKRAFGVGSLKAEERTAGENAAVKRRLDEIRQLPNDEDELALEIAEHEGRIAALGHRGSARDKADYERKREEARQLQTALSELLETQKNWSTKVDDMETAWLVPLQTLIDKVNRRFTQFFLKLDCAGEIFLKTTGRDYASYGVEIRVAFRAGQKLSRLTANQQSGGERSVSTMLYMLALQEITAVPFRCVDEINQGMDRENERKVFDTMASLLEEDTSDTQYFMLTPKLLSNLNYTPKMNIHVIHNAPVTTGLPPVEWKGMDYYIKKRQQMNDREGQGSA